MKNNQLTLSPHQKCQRQNEKQTSPVLQERAFQLSWWIPSKKNELLCNKAPFALQMVWQYLG